jgi:16S rRNA (adenine1518-N6/adenine1519-N6)-dimethyltransferase
MDLASLQTIQSLSKKYGIRPSKDLGQSFLIDQSILEKIVTAAELTEDDIVLEIGPGFGTLTQELARRVKKVIAVELDRRLVEAFHNTMAGISNVEIVQGDVLTLKIENWKLENYKIVANLPYSITSAVLRKFLEEEPKPSMIVVMVQKEVAERVCALPGEMSMLSVSVQFYGKPEIIGVVPRSSFWPEPEVDSAILRITNYAAFGGTPPKGGGPITSDYERAFFRLVRMGFSSRRKQLQNNLAGGLRISKEAASDFIAKAGLPSKVRAQELSIDDWKKLAANYAA